MGSALHTAAQAPAKDAASPSGSMPFQPLKAGNGSPGDADNAPARRVHKIVYGAMGRSPDLALFISEGTNTIREWLTAMMQHAQMSQNTSSEKMVRTYLGGYYPARDRAAIESVMAEDFHVTSPVDNRLERKTYLEHFRHLGLVALCTLVGCNIVLVQAQAHGKTSPLATGLYPNHCSVIQVRNERKQYDD
jgi:hypothetical protein